MEKRKLARRVQALVEAGGPLGAVSHIRATGQRRFWGAVFMSNRFRRENLDPVAFAS